MSIPEPYIGRIIFNENICGTGFLVHTSGLIATCWHVLIDAVGESPDNQVFVFELLNGDWKTNAHPTNKQDSLNDIVLLQA